MPATRSYSFGEYTLDLRRGALLRAGADVKLRPKSYEVLRLLIERHGQLVSRDELLQAVWGHAVVTDGVLGQSLIDARRAIGDASQQIIRTVPRRGYIFELPVVEEEQLNHSEHLNGHPAVAANQPAPPAIDASQPAPATNPPAAAPARRVAPAAIITAVLVLTGASAAGWWLSTTRDRAGAAPMIDQVASAPRNSIAVLPFVDMSPEQNQEYFADGMSEEILNLLANSAELQVIARTSSFSFKDRNADIAEIAAKLNVAHVLEGSVRKDGSRVRITAQLIDASDSSHLWSQTYDRELEDAFSVQSEIATRVAQALKVTMADRGNASAALAPNSQVHENYLRGRFFFNRRSPGDLARAEESYQAALRIDPRHARSWEGLVGVYGAQMSLGELARERGMQLRWQALQKALAYGPNLAEVHIRAAMHYASIDNHALADQHARKAYELERDNPQVLGFFGERLAWQNRLDEALTMMQRSVMLDPLSPIRRGNFAGYLAAAGRQPQARAELLKEMELNPAAKPDGDLELARLLVLEGRFPEARSMIPQLKEGDERDLLVAMVEHALGNDDAARVPLTAFQARQDPDAALYLAEIHALRGDADETFGWMAKARQRLGKEPWNTPHWHIGWRLRFSPFLRRFHDDPRWEEASRVIRHKVAG